MTAAVRLRAPARADVWAGRALEALRVTGDHVRAAKCAAHALRLDPRCAVAHVMRSELAFAAGDFAQRWREHAWPRGVMGEATTHVRPVENRHLPEMGGAVRRGHPLPASVEPAPHSRRDATLEGTAKRS